MKLVIQIWDLIRKHNTILYSISLDYYGGLCSFASFPYKILGFFRVDMIKSFMICVM